MGDTTEVLKSLALAARLHWEGGRDEDYFETELVRAEDHLLELEEEKTNADLRI